MENKNELSTSFWHLSTDDALKQLSCSTNGLNDSEAASRLKEYGPNTVKASSNASALILFLSQFKSPVTLLLIIAALLSAGLGDVADTIIILTIVLISSFLGFWQEKGAANAVKELLKMVQLHCTVLRNSQKKELPVESVVPGDLVYLSAGDVIPGDSLILESQELFIDEAAFTGETYPVEKSPCVLPPDTPLSKRKNSLFMGSHVISGKATALVIKTGTETEFGKISSSLQLRPPETDFEKGIRKFGYMLMEITLILVFIIFAVNVYLHKPVLDSFLFSLALAVGLTPQLLPSIISVNLSTGARRMAKQQVIVKRLSSIENFGSMNILCSDKTGTITAGKVNLKDTLDIDGNHSDKVLQYAWLNASMQQGFQNPIDEAIVSSYKGPANTFKLQAEIPYDFIRKRLTVQVTDKNQNVAITKGALNAVLSICTQAVNGEGKQSGIENCRDEIIKQYQQFSDACYRTLGVAYKPATATNFTKDDEKEMIFIGFITLFDPCRRRKCNQNNWQRI